MKLEGLARIFSLVGVLVFGYLFFGPGSYALAWLQDTAIVRDFAVTPEISIDTTPPNVTVTVSPTDLLKGRKGVLVQVFFSGKVNDYGSGLVWPSTVELIDEYGEMSKVIPAVFIGIPGGVWHEGWDISGPAYTGFVMVEVWAEGRDVDGRTYTIRHTASDLAGNRTVAEAKVTVRHDSAGGSAGTSSYSR